MISFKILDHGSLSLIDKWGSDESIIEAARMSTAKGFLGWGTTEKPGDEKLLQYLYERKHHTPFEMSGMTIEVQAPIFVFREWHRHRTQCLAGSTKLFFDPSGHGPFTIKHIFKHFGPDIQELKLRCVNEKTLKSEYTSIVNVWESGEKDVFDVEAKGVSTIRCSSDHRFFTPSGWKTLKEIISIPDDKSIDINTNNAEIYVSVKSSTNLKAPNELWLPVSGWENEYQISSHGRVKKTSTNEEFNEFTSTNDGYQCIGLISADKSELRGIHMMVLDAFESPYKDGMECIHLDKNPSNNNISNLQWKDCKKSKFKTVPQEILSVKYAGTEMTYDIEVSDPWHNFVAEGFIVHNSVNEMSARYIPLPDVNYIPSVERLLLNSKVNKQAGTIKGSEILDEQGAESFRASLAETYREQQSLYEKALQMGVPKELARVHLPVGRYSRMRVSANLRNWLGFLTLRMAPDAQWEIRQYANSVAELISLSFPRTYGLFKSGQK
jgi:flavin-dependent thymidylate synthase